MMVSHRSRPALFFTLVLITVVLCAFGQERYCTLRARALSPVPGAHWIWADGSVDDGVPVAFYAIGEVELEKAPEDAKLLVIADEDYRLHVNDQWIGGGRFRESQGPDVYPVGALLHPGRNRIVVELRSSRGAGGLLAAVISDARETPLLVTDGQWRIARRYSEDLMRHDLPLADLEAARVWGLPPTGRWQAAHQPVMRPRWFDAAQPRRRLVPRRGIGVAAGGHWRRLRPRHQLLPPPLHQVRTHFSWGREVRGVPVIDLRKTAGTVALVRVADALGDFRGAEMENRYMLMIPMPGDPYWRAPEPVRFRYLEVFGIVLEHRPFVIEVEAGVEVKVPSQLASQDRGLFGLEPLWQPSRAVRMAISRAQAAMQ
jgi:hypothetical protein